MESKYIKIGIAPSVLSAVRYFHPGNTIIDGIYARTVKAMPLNRRKSAREKSAQLVKAIQASQNYPGQVASQIKEITDRDLNIKYDRFGDILSRNDQPVAELVYLLDIINYLGVVIDFAERNRI